MNKKIIALISLVLIIASLTGCGKKEENVLKVGATPVPHAELLNLVKEDLKAEGITLEIVEFTDYVQPNLALSSKDIDANFFQHLPYLEDFNAANKLDLASIGTVHVEPLGLYSSKYKNIADIPEGATIAVPNDTTNEGRALLLLQANNIIKLDSASGLSATVKDITENPKNIIFKELESAQLPRLLADFDGAIINGNYALEAKLSPLTDALIIEGAESPYANILTVRKEDVNREDLKKLLAALQSEKVEKYILENYNGGVLPAFSTK